VARFDSRANFGGNVRDQIAVMPVSVDTPAATPLAQTRREPAPPAAPQARARARDPYYDNVKFLAVVLVVLGHAWYPLHGSRIADVAHVFIYIFHMPVFILIAGYFSRRFATGRGKVRRLVVGIGIPYLVFEAAYPYFAHVMHGDRFIWSPLSPYGLMWFLPALIVWRMSTPLWQQLRWPLPIALVISAVSGAVELSDQVATRTLGFLPFFVVGLLIKEEHIRLLRTPTARVLAVLLTIAAAATAVLAEPHMNQEWFNYRGDYADMHVSAWVGIAMRLGTLACGLAMTAAFLSLIPRRRLWFTDFGGRSMYVYLLHGFVVFGGTYADWYAYARHMGPNRAFVVVTVLGVLLAVVLSTKPVQWAFGWLIEPRADWAFRTRARR
jgi:fucose 4-O-acetylase-like acetyltransferase